MSMLATAIRIASTAHEGQLDKGGNAYILHPLTVMMNLRTKDVELMAMAVLHDVVEDSKEWTFEKLAAAGMSTRVVDGLKMLTHIDGESYEEYIKRISTNRDASRVKLEDLRHNMDPSRLKGLRQKDFDRLNKYTKAFAFLSRVLDLDQEIYQ
jgi:(p)ppGpp synthase/HD superfamily hydrolase